MAVPVLFLLLSSMCRTAAVPEGDVTPEFRLLSSGAYGARASRSVDEKSAPAVEIARDARAYVDAWSRIVGSGAPPPVDFEKESVVFLALGLRSSGGWSVVPEEVVVETNAARVKARVASPGPRDITTMAFTAPYSVIAVANRGFERAEWVDQDGTPVAKGPQSLVTE
ncbi:MAG: protease complex subunit PrcB family protein [Thermoanaerobaculia bacterium]